LLKAGEDQEEAISRADLTFQKHFAEVQQDRQNVMSAITQVNENFDRVSFDITDQRASMTSMQQGAATMRQSLEWLTNDAQKNGNALLAMRRSLASVEQIVEAQGQQIRELHHSAKAWRDTAMQASPIGSLKEATDACQGLQLAGLLSLERTGLATVPSVPSLGTPDTAMKLPPAPTIYDVPEDNLVSTTLPNSPLTEPIAEIATVLQPVEWSLPPGAEVPANVEAPGGGLMPANHSSASSSLAAALQTPVSSAFCKQAAVATQIMVDVTAPPTLSPRPAGVTLAVPPVSPKPESSIRAMRGGSLSIGAPKVSAAFDDVSRSLKTRSSGSHKLPIRTSARASTPVRIGVTSLNAGLDDAMSPACQRPQSVVPGRTGSANVSTDTMSATWRGPGVGNVLQDSARTSGPVRMTSSPMPSHVNSGSLPSPWQNTMQLPCQPLGSYHQHGSPQVPCVQAGPFPHHGGAGGQGLTHAGVPGPPRSRSVSVTTR
jgi:hypothetical protein